MELCYEVCNTFVRLNLIQYLRSYLGKAERIVQGKMCLKENLNINKYSIFNELS